MTQESISNKLSELFDLFKSGALTKDEYDQLKAKIINKNEVQPIIEKVQETEPDKEAKKEIVIEQPKELNDKDLESNQSIVEPVAKSNKKFGKKAIIAVVASIIIVVSIVLLVFKTTIFSSKSGSTGQNTQIVKDVDGNTYKTVTIGTQVWLAENLKTTKYNDGTTIPLNPDEKAWETLNTPAYCWYDNNETVNKNTCGALYNWYTVNTNNLCPTDWHVPTNEEWTTLIIYLGGEDVAGGKLKETGTTHWKSPNTGASNETGFTALPSGYLHHLGTFKGIGSFNFWWSSSEYDATQAWNSNVSYNHSKVNRNNYMFQNGLSVRCLQDLGTSKNNLPVTNTPIVENKTAVWDEVAATKIIMDELSKYDWSKIAGDKSYEWNHEIVGFNKISLNKKDIMVTLVNDKHKFGRDLSIFEFEDYNGWKLKKKSIAFCQGEITPLSNQKNLYLIAPDNYGVLIKSEWGERNSQFVEKDIYAFINSELKVIFSIHHSFGNIERNPDFELNFITGTDGYYIIETLDKDDYYSITKFRYKFNGVEYVKE